MSSPISYISVKGGTPIPLEHEPPEDTFGRSVVEHEYTHVDGADLEDTGKAPRSTRMVCHFWDDAGHLTYDNHLALLELLNSSDMLELDHFAYGSMEGKVKQLLVRHDDADRYAIIELQFVQQGSSATAPSTVVDVASSLESTYSSAVADESGRISTAMLSTLGPEAYQLLEVEIPETASILDSFSGISTTAWSYVARIDSAVRTLEGTLDEITVPANALISSIDFSTDLPGRIIGSVAACVERYVILNEKLLGSPRAFVESFRRGIIELEAALPDSSEQLHALGAARCCLALGEIFSADNDIARSNLAAQDAPLFDASGSYVSPPAQSQAMTVDEMEQVTATVRSWIQECIDADRTRTDLKTAALALLDHLDLVKAERERLVSISVDQPTPLHIICHANGLSWRDAERLLLINRIPWPSQVKGRVQIYAA